jgi:hypothetical protein
MNRDEITRMAREAGIDEFGSLDERLIFFAALVAAAAKEEMLMAGNDQWLEEARKTEREACAKVCDARYMGDNNRDHHVLEDMEARRCAAAIRARGQE